MKIHYCSVFDLQAQHPGLGDFDCVVFDEQLYWAQNPLPLLRDAATWLRPKGRVIVREPDLGSWHTWIRRIARRPDYRDLGAFDRAGVNLVTQSVLSQWFSSANLLPGSFSYETPPEKPNYRTQPVPARGLFRRWILGTADSREASSRQRQDSCRSSVTV